MTELSPQAQAVRDAVLATYADNIPKDDRLWALERDSVVVALRSVADQVVPEMEHPEAEEWLGQSAWLQAEASVRFRLLAIAAELEANS